MEHKRKIMTQTSISKLLLKFSIPAITGMIAQAMYNVVDTIFVGRGVGTDAIAALTVAFPILLLTTSVGIWLGTGGASVISRYLGQKKIERAQTAFVNMFVPGIVVSIMLTILFVIYTNEVLVFFGASKNILPISREYFFYILPSFVFIVIKMTSNNAIRSDGSPKYAMFIMVSGALLNILFDAVFIFGLSMGVKGAALATTIAQGISAIPAIMYFFLKSSNIQFKKATFFLDFKLFKEIALVGSASFFQSLMLPVIQGVLNRGALKYGGDIGVAFIGIFMRSFSLLIMPLHGFAQGMVPIAGFSYGAELFKRTKDVIIKSIIFGTIFISFGYIILQFAPSMVISVFTKDVRLIEMSESSIRTITSFLFLVPFVILGSSAYQALGKGKTALLINIIRQGFLFVPLAVVLPLYFGLKGLWYTFPISDILTFLLLIIILPKEFKLLNRSVGI